MHWPKRATPTSASATADDEIGHHPLDEPPQQLLVLSRRLKAS
jgi:hypothetical protein